METSYDPNCWTCIGNNLLTQIAKDVGNVSSVEEITPTPFLPVVPELSFHPHHYTVAPSLYFSEDPISFETYASWFMNTSAIHFYNAITSNILVEDDPSHFLYALLGPQYCPYSYYSTTYF